MPWLNTQTVALSGLALLAAVAVTDNPFSLIGFIATAALATACIALGVKRHRPASVAPWRCFNVAVGLFGLSYSLRLFFPELRALPSEDPTVCDLIDAFAFAMAILGAHKLGKVRDRYKDPTTVIDSLILSAGVSAIVWIFVLMPYVNDHEAPILARVMGVSVSTLSLWLVFVIARMAFGPGARTPAFVPLGACAFFSMVSQVLSSTGEGATGGQALVFGGLALLCCALAALDPSMTKMTEPSSQKIGQMSAARLVFMTGAVLASPVALFAQLIEQSDDVLLYSGLIGSWILVTGLVMIRLGGLVRARERVAATERALRHASAKLVSATDQEETYEAALEAMFEVASAADDLRASFALADDEFWTVVASRGLGAKEALDRKLDATFMTAMLESTEGKPVQLDDSLPLDAPRSGASCTLVIPLSSRRRVRGAMLLSSKAPLPAFVVEALKTLSSDVSLAVEAIGLAEDLHRRRSEQRFEALVQHSNDVTAVLDATGSITYVSPASLTVLGKSPEALLGHRFADLAHPDDQSVIEELVLLLGPEHGASRQAEIRVTAERDTYRTLELVVTDLRHEPSISGVVINAHDITDRKALEEDLRHKVLHDDLTGIANRVLFRERVAHALISRNRYDSVTAVLHINLDDFKTINDGLGHEIGDELLKVIADRLQAFLRSGDTAARLGADEFAILLENLYTSEDVNNACHRLLSIIQEPVQFGSRSIDLSGSIGVALATENITAEVFIRNADVALHQAKAGGKGTFRLFDEQMYESAFERLELKADLQHALAREELILHYQPLVALNDGRLIGFEALVRWIHPTRGFISPMSFIPLAEETGAIVPIGAWVLETALRQLAKWRAEAPGADFGMSVNLSPRQLDDDSIEQSVKHAIRNSGVAAEWVTLELTESFGLSSEGPRERLRALGQLGCEIAADDFGTGFASYAALQQLPFTNVKIDRSLIMGLSEEDPRAQAHVRSIIEMGHATGLTVTAEGIEDARQRDVLAAMGADKGQGYFFGKPCTAKDAGQWVKDAALGKSSSPMTSE